MCWQKHWQQQEENREGQFNIFHTPSVCFMSTAISLKFIEGPQTDEVQTPQKTTEKDIYFTPLYSKHMLAFCYTLIFF